MNQRTLTIGLTAAAGACLLLALGAAGKPPVPVIKDCRDCPEMVTIPAGEFLMGSPRTESHRGAETQHKVVISAPFAVGRFEVTFAQWDACVAGGGCGGYRPDAPWGRGEMPVVNVSWKNAKAYVDWLSRKTGKPYRLLSEAEWEYAARGGTATAFAYGPTLSPEAANFDGGQKTDLNPKGRARGRTVKVGTFPPNAFGLHDVHGNVWEWVEDCWNDDYGPALPADGKPALSGDCNGHILRGGSWEDGAADVRAAARVGGATGDRSWSDGFGSRATSDPTTTSGLFLPAALRALLPVGQGRPLPLERSPLLARQLELIVVLAVEQHQRAGVAAEVPRLGSVDQEQGLGAVGVVVGRGQQHRLARGHRFAVQPVRQEALVAVAPQPAVQMLQPVGRARADDRPPAALQGLLQKLGQGLVQPGSLQVIEPDLAGRRSHQSS